VLDLGRGTGRITACVAGLPERVIAIDYSLSSLRVLGENRLEDARLPRNGATRSLPLTPCGSASECCAQAA